MKICDKNIFALPMTVTKYAGRFLEPGESFEAVRADVAKVLLNLGCDAKTLRYGYCETDPERGERHFWFGDIP